MKFYKILHKPTGLYYKPGATHLATLGKVYAKKPNLQQIMRDDEFYLSISEPVAKRLSKKGVYIGVHRKTVMGDFGKHIICNRSDFEIKEFTTE